MKANFTAVRDSVQQTALMTRGYAEEDNNELEFKIRDFISVRSPIQDIAVLLRPPLPPPPRNTAEAKGVPGNHHLSSLPVCPASYLNYA